MPEPTNLYPEIVVISQDFLGPEGERYIRRQIEAHLSIKPEDIQARHIPKLIDWVQLMAAMTTEDSRAVDTFTDKLLGLARQNQSSGRAKGEA